MRVNLDNCCLNRPFDDQTQVRIRLETEAKLDVRRRIQEGEIELAWSYILDYENSTNPFMDRRQAIRRWRVRAVVDVVANTELLEQARQIAQRGVPPKDALHIASAVVAGCSHFLTTDDKVLRKTRDLRIITVVNPVDFVIQAL